MVDRRRHAPTARHLGITPLSGRVTSPTPIGPLLQITQGHLRRGHAEPRKADGLRWLISTCLAAAVGAVAILVVIYGSSDPIESPGGLMPT